MTPEDYKILKEKAELWDSLSDCLKTQFVAKFPYSEILISKELSKKLNLDDSWSRVDPNSLKTNLVV